MDYVRHGKIQGRELKKRPNSGPVFHHVWHSPWQQDFLSLKNQNGCPIRSQYFKIWMVFYDLIKNHPLFAFMVEWSLNRNHLANSLNSQVWHLTFCQGEDFGFIWTLQCCCLMCSVQFKFFISDFLLHHLILYHFYEGRQDLKLIWKT